MNERKDAVKAALQPSLELLMPDPSGQYSAWVADTALAAADAVMFSDEAVERAARALSFRMDDITRLEAIEDVRAVIAALKS